MIRTLLLSAAAVFACAPPAAAQANDISPVGMEVRGDDGTLMGRVTGVSRDPAGRLVGVYIEGLAPPAAAPRARPRRQAPSPAIARNEREAPRMIRSDRDVRLAGGR